MRILLVDDDDDIRGVVGIILRSKGHIVDEAIDGHHALEQLRGEALPNLILLDMMMPRLDGEAVLAALRRDSRLASIPVVLLSGHPSVSERAEQLGVEGYLVKPIELSELVLMVQNVAARPALAGHDV